jgi:hypothetical protein
VQEFERVGAKGEGEKDEKQRWPGALSRSLRRLKGKREGGEERRKKEEREKRESS